MSTPHLDDLARRLVERAVALGASAADAVAVEAESRSVQVRLGEVENTTGARDKGIGLRVFRGHRSASASTSDFTPAALERLVADTCDLARYTEEDPFSGLPDEVAPPVVADLRLSDGGAALSMEARLDLALRAEQAAMEADPRIGNSEGAQFDSALYHTAYASSAGFSGGYTGSSYTLSVVPVANDAGGMQRDHWYSSVRHFEDLESPEAVGRIAAQRVLRRLGARKVSTCEVPVVFDPDMARSLIGHIISAVSGSAVYKGTSFLGDKLGKVIAASGVTLVDDPLMVKGPGSRPFDGEGVAVRKNVVVDGGVLSTFLLDSYSARKLSMKTTGSASRLLGDPPAPGASNFYMVPGSHTPEDIIRSVPSGLYVTELIGFGVNGVTGDYSRGAAGLWIHNGELAYPVEEVTIAGSLLDMFQAIEMIGNDLRFRNRVNAPTLKISRMTVAGE